MKKDISKLILITDLDGTFLPASKEISKKDMESINKFISSGGNFTIATGRPIQSVRRYFNEVNLTLPVILYNGGMIFDHKNDKIVWRSELPAEARNIVSRVLKEFPKASAEILTYENVYVV